MFYRMGFGHNICPLSRIYTDEYRSLRTPNACGFSRFRLYARHCGACVRFASGKTRNRMGKHCLLCTRHATDVPLEFPKNSTRCSLFVCCLGQTKGAKLSTQQTATVRLHHIISCLICRVVLEYIVWLDHPVAKRIVAFDLHIFVVMAS